MQFSNIRITKPANLRCPRGVPAIIKEVETVRDISKLPIQWEIGDFIDTMNAIDAEFYIALERGEIDSDVINTSKTDNKRDKTGFSK
ncbi:MAG: hypothetical protein LLG42_16255 [Chloroflexi bacterium]|nr:hypothetical protein [Chloroflexota bacterium]